MDGAGDDNKDTAIDALVQGLVGKNKRMQLPDKCLAYGIIGFDEILQKAKCITVSCRLQMILKWLLTYGHSENAHQPRKVRHHSLL